MSIDQYRNKIISGDALTVLHQLPDESVHRVITSPPYWGLRKYEGKEQNQVWRGSKDCEHEWKKEVRAAAAGSTGKSKNKGNFGSESQTQDHVYSLCVRCGAWRGQLGLEPTPDLYVQHLVEVFREVKRVLRSEGTFWLDIGDSYMSAQNVIMPTQTIAKGQTRDYVQDEIPPNRRSQEGLKQKDLVGIPWRVAFALQADGSWLRSDIIWSKPNPMPESVQDRPTKSHEYVFLLAKSPQYFYDVDAIRESRKDPEDDVRRIIQSRTKKNHPNPAWATHGSGNVVMDVQTGRNKRSVWTIPTQPFKGAHFAVFPEALIEPMVKAGCPENGVVLDPFVGSGTTCLVAAKLNRDWIGIDVSEKYCAMARERLAPYATKLEAFAS